MHRAVGDAFHELVVGHDDTGAPLGADEVADTHAATACGTVIVTADDSAVPSALLASTLIVNVPFGAVTPYDVASPTGSEAITGPPGAGRARMVYAVGAPPEAGGAHDMLTTLPLTVAWKFVGGPGGAAAATNSAVKRVTSPNEPVGSTMPSVRSTATCGPSA